MANRQVNPDTYNVGHDDAREGNPANPPEDFNKEDREQYKAGYSNYDPRQ